MIRCAISGAGGVPVGGGVKPINGDAIAAAVCVFGAGTHGPVQGVVAARVADHDCGSCSSHVFVLLGESDRF